MNNIYAHVCNYFYILSFQIFLYSFFNQILWLNFLYSAIFKYKENFSFLIICVNSSIFSSKFTEEFIKYGKVCLSVIL